jgi:hypothetical protein
VFTGTRPAVRSATAGLIDLSLEAIERAQTTGIS